MKQLLSIEAVVKESLEVYLVQWLSFWKLIAINGVAVLFIVPFLLLAFFLDVNIYLRILLYILLAVSCINAIVVSLLVNVAFLLIAKDKKSHHTIKELLKASLPLAISYFWVSLLVALSVLGGTILLIIPGIIFMVWLLFSEYVFVFEGKKGVEALRESKRLAQGHWWPLFGRLALMVLVSGVVSSLPNIGGIINAFFLGPLFVIYLCLIYEDLKRIKSSVA